MIINLTSLIIDRGISSFNICQDDVQVLFTRYDV